MVEGRILYTKKNDSTPECVQGSFEGGEKGWKWYNCGFRLRLTSNRKMLNTKVVDNTKI